MAWPITGSVNLTTSFQFYLKSTGFSIDSALCTTFLFWLTTSTITEPLQTSILPMSHTHQTNPYVQLPNQPSYLRTERNCVEAGAFAHFNPTKYSQIHSFKNPKPTKFSQIHSFKDPNDPRTPTNLLDPPFFPRIMFIKLRIHVLVCILQTRLGMVTWSRVRSEWSCRTSRI